MPNYRKELVANYYRYRQRNPEKIINDSYQTLRFVSYDSNTKEWTTYDPKTKISRKFRPRLTSDLMRLERFRDVKDIRVIMGVPVTSKCSYDIWKREKLSGKGVKERSVIKEMVIQSVLVPLKEDAKVNPPVPLIKGGRRRKSL